MKRGAKYKRLHRRGPSSFLRTGRASALGHVGFFLLPAPVVPAQVTQAQVVWAGILVLELLTFGVAGGILQKVQN